MRAPVSIVIPTLNAAADLPMALACLAEGLEAGLIREVIVSDGGSDDASCSIADQTGAVVIHGAPGRGGQLQRGAAAAQGDWLMFVHADTQLGPGWAPAVLDHLGTRPDSAGYFPLAFRANGPAPWLVAAWANARSRWFGLPYGDQGLLISRRLYEQVGGYTDFPLMEDVAIVRALRGRLVALDGVAHTSALRYQQQGWARRGGRNLMTLARYFCGTDPRVLADRYRSR